MRRVPSAARRVARFAAMAAALLFAPVSVRAQVSPNLDWRTIRTTHFYVHFTPPTEGLARRIAADAERAYEQLSAHLHPPRGMIDVVISDDVDQSNGSATPTPTNRIVIYANPPVSESALRYTNDWAQLVMTHELTHIFHLDRSRGVWWLGQKILGRAPLLFPNSYSPSWVTEGLAVYEESKLAGAGRVEGSEHRMIARAAAIDHRFPSVGALSLAQGRFPFGETAYSFGSLFIDFLAKEHGDSAVRKYVEKASANLIPYLVNIPAKQGFGLSFSRGWKQFEDSVAKSISPESRPVLPGWRELTRDGVFVFSPRWQSDSSIIYSGAPGRETFGAFRVDLNGNRTRVGRRNSRSPNVTLADGSILYAQLSFVNPYQERSDLWIQRGGRERQLTFGQRLTSPDARSDGEIVAAQILPGATRLVRVSKDGKRIAPITTGSYDEQWTEPRWSPSGKYIAASRWLRGNISQIVVVDTTGRIVRIVSSGHSIEATPSWFPNDEGVLYSSDRTGTTQLYVERFASESLAVGTSVRLTDVQTGIFEPSASPSSRVAAVVFRADGYHLGVDLPTERPTVYGDTKAYVDTTPSASAAPVVSDTSRATRYSPWRTLIPRYWLPTIEDGIDGGYRIGGTTLGYDVVGRHTIRGSLAFPTNNTGVVGDFSYQYSGLGLPVLQVDGAQSWESLGGVFSRVTDIPIVGEVFRRTLSADALATWIRQRTRTALSMTAGFGVEYRTHVSTPDRSLLASIDTSGALGALTFPSIIAAAGFANYQRPPFSISPEDGVQLNVTIRDRLRSGVSGTGAQSVSVVGSGSVYKSLDFPGFAHHVLAIRGAGGYADERAAGYFLVGGVSGNTFEIIPGYTLGEGRKTFPVRGFEAGTLAGIRAVSASAEYRIPLFLTGWSPSVLPLFFDRSSVALFSDFGTAWCPTVRGGREVCNRAGQDDRIDIASAGAELNLNLGLLSWDSPYRFRLGVVTPTYDGNYFGRPKLQAYVVAGVSF
jgi:Tol biopolymer transport system component